MRRCRPQDRYAARTLAPPPTFPHSPALTAYCVFLSLSLALSITLSLALSLSLFLTFYCSSPTILVFVLLDELRLICAQSAQVRPLCQREVRARKLTVKYDIYHLYTGYM